MGAFCVVWEGEGEGPLSLLHISVHARGLPHHYEVRCSSLLSIDGRDAERCLGQPAGFPLRAQAPLALPALSLSAPASFVQPPQLIFKCFFFNLQVQGEDDWMTKYFFSGGTMPSIELMLMFQDDLAAQKQW